MRRFKIFSHVVGNLLIFRTMPLFNDLIMIGITLSEFYYNIWCEQNQTDEMTR